jgi:quinolinate synthase
MMTDDTNLLERTIARLKDEKGAIILAHNYQVPEIQEIADLVGDSLELSRAAAQTAGNVIIFCGVDFMAETAAILSPDRPVILPAGDACCPMAQMVTAGEIKTIRKRYPGAAVVCYVNTTAEVKAESDICCTSAKAVRVVSSLEENQVIFVPDQNLARYVARFTSKEIIPWEGFCIVHDRFTREDVYRARRHHPAADVIVHPECRPEVIDLADGVFSTSGMISHVRASPNSEFIIGTEIGIIPRMQKLCPEKQYYPLSKHAICENMKKTTLSKVCHALETLEPRITVPVEIAVRARRSIDRMLGVH